MRLRNIPNAKDKLDKSNYIIHNYLEMKGNFKKVFFNDNPIYLEIGTGKGNFIIENAKRYPNINFIGIEKYDSVLVRAIEKIDELELNNLRFIRMDAKEIENVFDKEISKLYLNFSDPWPKDRHEKRRLTSDVFLEHYDNIFAGKKIIEFKTDNRKLFEYSVKSFTDYNYKIQSLSLDLHSDVTDNIMTEYEAKFSNKGQVIYYVKVSK